MTPVQTMPKLYPPTVTPAPEGLHPLSYVAKVVINPLRGVPERAYLEPVVHYPFLGSDLVWVTRPDLVERILLHEADCFIKSPLEKRVLGPTLGDGLLTASAASWKWQRKLAAPLFRHSDVLGYVPQMSAAADRQLAKWRAQSRQPLVSNVLTDMKAATFEVIVNTILAGCDAHEAEIIQRADKAYIHLTPWAVAASIVGTPEWMWHPGKRPMARAASEMRGAVQAIVRRRRSALETSGEGASDIMGRMLAARHPDTHEPMTDARMVDNLATFLEAGHQTTAQALTWALYLLARAPQWQDRIRAEVIAAAGVAPITAEHTAHMPITLRVLKETMRLYPPAPVVVRLATQACELAGTPVPKGSQLVVSTFILHRHRALWEDPDRFDPDRFLPEREAALPRGQYMPFGFGPRTCIGMPFAMVEGLSMLATLVRGARFSCDAALAPEPVSQVTLSPKGGMPLSISML